MEQHVGMTICDNFKALSDKHVVFIKFCIFHGSNIEIGKGNLIVFEHCYFKAGSSLTVSGYKCHITHCRFDKGSQFRTSCEIVMKTSEIAPDCAIFTGGDEDFVIENCEFGKGEFKFSSLDIAPTFSKCEFGDETILMFGPRQDVIMEDCLLGPETTIVNGPDSDVYMTRSRWYDPLFKNDLGHIDVTRHFMSHRLDGLPPCERLIVRDEWNAEPEDGYDAKEKELKCPLILPMADRIEYLSTYEMYEESSILNLAMSLMTYPNLTIYQINWCGEEDVLDKLMRMNNPVVRKNLANMLTLLSSICVKRLGTRSALRKLPMEMFKECRSFLML